MHEERTNLRSIPRRIEERIFAPSVLISAVERLTFAPYAAGHDDGLGLRDILRHQVRSIRNELAVDAVDRLQSAFNLARRIIRGLQSAYVRFDNLSQPRDISRNGFAYAHNHGKLQRSGILAPRFCFIPYNDLSHANIRACRRTTYLSQEGLRGDHS